MQGAPHDPWQAPEDDLFRPTVAATMRDPSLPKPWRVSSQLWVAFFGGCFAVLAIAWTNTYRLGMDWRNLGIRMVGATVLAWTLVTVALLGVMAWSGLDNEYTRYFRWGYRGAALLLHLGFARLQAPAERRYVEAAGDEGYASLWGAGLLAVVLGAVVQGIVTIVALVPMALFLEDAP